MTCPLSRYLVLSAYIDAAGQQQDQQHDDEYPSPHRHDALPSVIDVCTLGVPADGLSEPWWPYPMRSASACGRCVSVPVQSTHELAGKLGVEEVGNEDAQYRRGHELPPPIVGNSLPFEGADPGWQTLTRTFGGEAHPV
jgi:hypothetical protein